MEGGKEWRDTENRLGCSLLHLTSGGIDLRDHEVLTGKLTYPGCIKERECIGWVTEVERYKQTRTGAARFRPTYAPWVNSLPDCSFEKEDTYTIKKMFAALLFNWDDHEMANARAEKRGADIRFGVDALIKMAFQFRRKHTHRAEVDLFLPGAPWVAKADNICTIELPSDWLLFLSKLPNKHIFSADENSFAVITFICEDRVHERRFAAKQLTLNLCSAQHQRRALGFEDSKVFGATLVDTELHFFASEWEEDTVFVYPTTKRFDLKAFDEYLSCYIFLCRLADFEAANVQSVFDMWKSEKDRQKIKNRNTESSQKTPWRPVAVPSVSSSKKRKQGDGEGDDVESVYMFDQDQSEDEAGKDTTEVRNEDDERVPPGGLSLSKQNLRALDHLSRIKRIPGPPDIDE